MKQFYPEYVWKDAPGTTDAANEQLDLIVDGCHVYGTIYTPSKIFTEPHPVVVFFHGFPGTGHMDDLILAFRRCGCVTMTVYQRGAWGSDGKYLVSRCIEDAKAVLTHIRSDAFTDTYHTDPEHIYFIGHSMGGNTVINTAKDMDGLKGLILLAPFDPTLPMRMGHPELYQTFLSIGLVMHTDGIDAMAEDIMAHPEYEFLQALDTLKDMDLYLATAKADGDAPYDAHAAALWEALAEKRTAALHRKKEYDCGHGFDSARIELTEDIAAFLAESIRK